MRTSKAGLLQQFFCSFARAEDHHAHALRKEGTNLTAALQPDVFEGVVREGFPCQEKFAVPPGEYTLRLGVRDNATGLIGTADTKLVTSELPLLGKALRNSSPYTAADNVLVCM